MRRTLLVILHTLKWALILCAFVYVALVLVNLRDEELSAEERSLAQYHNPAVVDGQNAYLALLGFGAAAGADPIDDGARRIADHNAAAAGDPWGRERLAKIAEGKLQTAEGGKLSWAGGPLELPDAFDPSYLDQARAHAGEVQQLMACDDEILPLQSRIDTVADDSDLEEVYNTERHLLYVACTRARDQLLVTSVEPKSEFLDDLMVSC